MAEKKSAFNTIGLSEETTRDEVPVSLREEKKEAVTKLPSWDLVPPRTIRRGIKR